LAPSDICAAVARGVTPDALRAIVEVEIAVVV
jgi:hypothetical protein